MNLSYKILEKDYYKTLRFLSNCLNVKNKSISDAKLPYLLENKTFLKLKPKSCWIISAISGAGKTTISKQLVSVKFIKLPNVTTRLKRSEEKDGDYIFINKSKFLSWNHKNLLFHPHKRNGVWQAILKKDIEKLKKGKTLFYLDKSVASSIILEKSLPKKVEFTFLYLLAPTFKELLKRILKRESLRRKKEKRLNEEDILKRFKEEINDMRKSINLPYVYIVNDSLSRVRKLLNKPIKDSRSVK